ncbi:MAG: DUF4115 domain-containing protein, partial [Pseudomonadota bacterium]
VQFAPVDQTPVVLTELDPLAGVQNRIATSDPITGLEPANADLLDRLYRPQALDLPVLVARDAPISTLTPDTIGALVPDRPIVAEPDTSLAELDLPEVPSVQVVEADVPELQLVAVRPAWVRVQSASGTVIYEGVMAPGQNFVVPATEEPARLRVGESGAMYFAVNGVHYGPVGETGTVTSNVELTVESLTSEFALADLTADDDLAQIVNVAEVAVDQ